LGAVSLLTALNIGLNIPDGIPQSNPEAKPYYLGTSISLGIGLGCLGGIGILSLTSEDYLRNAIDAYNNQ